MDSPTKQGWEFGGLFPFLVLSVCDDVANVFVVNVASYIWREGVPHVLDLQEEAEGENEKLPKHMNHFLFPGNKNTACYCLW